MNSILIWFMIAGIVLSIASTAFYRATVKHNWRTPRGDTFACGFVLCGILGASLVLGPIHNPIDRWFYIVPPVYLLVYFGSILAIYQRARRSK